MRGCTHCCPAACTRDFPRSKLHAASQPPAILARTDTRFRADPPAGTESTAEGAYRRSNCVVRRMQTTPPWTNLHPPADRAPAPLLHLTKCIADTNLVHWCAHRSRLQWVHSCRVGSLVRTAG